MIKDYIETYWQVFKLETEFFFKYWWVIIFIGVVYLMVTEYMDRRK